MEQTAKLQIKGMMVHAEQDLYNDGCQLNTGWAYDHEFFSISADSKEGLLFKLCNDFNVAIEDMELNACDDKGRIDIGQMVDAHGCVASDIEMAQWKEGKIELYAQTSTMYVQEVYEFDFEV